GAVQCKVFLKDNLRYEISFKNKPVIETSRLLFTLDGVELTAAPEAGDVKTYRVNETYPWRGNHALATNHCNGATIALQRGGVSYSLELRAYNDGIAYRFVVPAAGNKTRTPDEGSAFVVPEGSLCWYHDLGGHYEGQHTNSLAAEVPA